MFTQNYIYIKVYDNKSVYSYLYIYIYFYLEVQNRKEKKRKDWDAIKRATNIYKNNLDFGINMEDKEDNNDVKVLFFKNNEHTNGKYYVHMIKEDESWIGKYICLYPLISKLSIYAINT